MNIKQRNSNCFYWRTKITVKNEQPIEVLFYWILREIIELYISKIDAEK